MSQSATSRHSDKENSAYAANAESKEAKNGWLTFSPPHKKSESSNLTANETFSRSALPPAQSTVYIPLDVEQPQDNTHQDEETEEVQVPTLKITRFAAAPWVEFGAAKYYPQGSSAAPLTRILHIENPSDRQETLTIDPLDATNGFAVDQNQLVIAPRSVVPVVFSWKPAGVGNFREDVTIKTATFRLKAILLATGTEKLGVKNVTVKIEIMGGKNEAGENQVYVTEFTKTQATDDATAIAKSKAAAMKPKRPTVFTSARRPATASTPKATAAVSRLAAKALEMRTPSKSTQPAEQQTPSRGARPSTTTLTASIAKRQKIADDFKTPSKTIAKPNPTGILENAVNALTKKYESDGRWAEKQEEAFKKWLNFILTMDDRHDDKLDLARSVTKPRDTNMTPRQLALLKRKSTVRQAARALFIGSEATRVYSKVVAEVESGKLRILDDKFIYGDFGLRNLVTQLFVSSYATHHLHLALETLLGETIPGPIAPQQDYGHALELVLTKYLVNRILFDEKVAASYEGLVKTHYKEGFKPSLDKVVLPRILMLIWLLDRFKTNGILEDNSCLGISSASISMNLQGQNPSCLFKTSSTIKNSSGILCAFAKEFLAGEGDFVRHMALLGYTLQHEQEFLDEFDFSVTSVRADLRDGVRLARLAEILSKRQGLSKGPLLHQLRTPSVSRLQKMHNIRVAMERFHLCGLKTLTETEIREILDGHQIKTLSYLWQIILHAQLPSLISADQVRYETQRVARLNLIAALDAQLKKKASPFSQSKPAITAESDPSACIFSNSNLFSALLDWAREICLRYNVAIQNFTTSFSDGRAFCYLIHFYVPELLDEAKIEQHTSTRLEENLRHALNQQEAIDTLDLDELPSSPGPLDGNWVGVYSPPSGISSSVTAVLEAERKNFSLAQHALSKIGFIPNMLSSFDMSNTLPDEKVVVTFLCFLCSRLVEVAAERRATIVIQRAFRAWYSQNQHVREARATFVLQRYVRGYQQRNKFNALKNAALTIQTAWRAKQAQKHVVKLRAALRIQAWWRMVLAQKRFRQMNEAATKIQAWWRMVQARKEYQAKQKAALVIQSRFRMIQAQKQYHALTNAAVVLQTAIRARAARTQVERIRAAIKIQAWWRMILAKREFAQKTQAALTIQSWWRMISTRRHFQQLQQSAITIQTAIRALNARKEMIRMESAATTIQAWYRMAIARKQFKEYQLQKRTDAALKIQAWWRMILAKRDFHRRNDAALKIQSWWRMVLAKREFSQQVKAATVIQTHWRMVAAQKEAHQKKEAIVKIQSWYRMVSARKQYAQLTQAAITIQSAIRAKQARAEATRIRAVLKIQSWWRMVLVQKQVSKQRDAALKIQSWWRMIMARKSYQEQQAAALKIQSWWRMIVAKKHFAQLQSSAVVLQTAIRARQARIHVERVRAAIKIQSWWRMVLARKEYARKEEAALKIQSWWRMVLARRSFETQQSAALKIQSWWRMIMAKKHYAKLEQSAIVLQSAIRARHARVEATRVRAAIKIQSWWRMVLAKKAFAQKEAAALKIQSWWRMVSARKAFEEKKQAAVKIQAWWRMIMAKKHNAKLEQSAIIIQSAIRARQARIQASRVRAAIKIQSWWRMVLARKEFARKEAAALKIQSWWRMVSSQRTFQTQQTAALKIQSWWRMVSARKQYAQLTQAAITIQSAIRAKQARAEATRIRAVLKIQSWWRMVLVQKQVSKQRDAALKIQSWWRMIMARKSYQEQQAAALKIQSWWRMIVAKKHFAQLQSSAVVLQTAIRARQARIHVERVRAAIKIQSWWRMVLARKEYARKEEAALKIQSWWRMVLARRSFETQQSAALKIQSWWRMIMAKKHYAKQLQATVVIQSAYRALRARNEKKQMEAAATAIQAAYRGQAQRERTAIMKNGIQAIQALVRAKQAREDAETLKREKWAALVVQRRWRAKTAAKEQMTLEKATLRIQALYRGYRVRRDAKLARIAVLRAKIAESRATTPVSQSLGYRTNEALRIILEGTKLTDIVSACTVLEQSTRYSDTCALYVIEVEACKILFGVMETCNRSAPHISVLKIILEVISHICSWTKTRSGLVAQQPDVLERLATIMTNFKDVPEVFNRAALAFLAIAKPLPEVGEMWLSHAPAQTSTSAKHSNINLGRLTTLSDHIQKRLAIEKKSKKPANLLALSQESSTRITELCQLMNKITKAGASKPVKAVAH